MRVQNEAGFSRGQLSGPKQPAEKLYFAISFEGAWLYRLRKNSTLPSVLKGHGFSHADKVNQISVGFSFCHRV